jgi:hypothetical protein
MVAAPLSQEVAGQEIRRELVVMLRLIAETAGVAVPGATGGLGKTAIRMLVTAIFIFWKNSSE